MLQTGENNVEEFLPFFVIFPILPHLGERLSSGDPRAIHIHEQRQQFLCLDPLEPKGGPVYRDLKVPEGPDFNMRNIAARPGEDVVIDLLAELFPVERLDKIILRTSGVCGESVPLVLRQKNDCERGTYLSQSRRQRKASHAGQLDREQREIHAFCREQRQRFFRAVRSGHLVHRRMLCA